MRPAPDEQKVIAGILGVLDDKIELNRRTNATLESMARALFQSWFTISTPSARNSTSLCQRALTEQQQPFSRPNFKIPPLAQFHWVGESQRSAPRRERNGPFGSRSPETTLFNRGCR